MQRMSLPWFLDVVSAIDEIPPFSFEPEPKPPMPWVLTNARNQLDALFSKSIYSPYLKASRERAGSLYGAIQAVIDAQAKEGGEVGQHDLWNLTHERDQFKTVFVAELSTFPAFLVSGKESYETNLLIDEGSRLFPAALRAKAPEAIPDAFEAGKALAFELATACGFHIFRVTEAVVKRYWDHVTGGKPRPRLQTLGSFASEMETAKFGDEKVIEAIKQMTKLHRNPLIHPEVILTVEEAIETLGIARSVVGAMLRALPDVPPTTTTVAAG